MLGVFDNNQPAFCCYTSLGFNEQKSYERKTYGFFGEKWSITEMELFREDFEKNNNR